MFFKVFYLFCAIQINNVLSESVNGAVQNTQPKYLSNLQSIYLEIETILWTRIDSFLKDSKEIQNVEEILRRQNEISKAIIAIHKEVFFGDTFEMTSYWRSYLIYGIENLKEKLTTINDTLEENYGFLYDANQQNIIYDVSTIEQWTREAMFRRLRTNIDGLFDVTSEKENVMQHIRNEAKSCVKYVKYVISEIQLVREYHVTVGKALFRGHAMFQLAHMLVGMNGNFENNRHEADVERKHFTERYTKFNETITEILNRASRDLWKCNPNPYLNNREYYTAITNFMQGYIDNEINLSTDKSCSGTCTDVKAGKNVRCDNGTICAHENFRRTKCGGEIFDCDVIQSSGTACLVSDEVEKIRYNYVKFDNGSMNGREILCFKAEQSTFSAWNDQQNHECSQCFCFCDEPGENSDRYFSLHEVTADIDANKVITGIALQKINRVIQFVITERDLLPFGAVNDTLRRTQPWKMDDFEFLNSDASTNGMDYFTLTRENRQINLDTINLPRNMLVTGVRFQVYDNRLTMEVRGTEFDFRSGRLLNLARSVWLNNLSDKVRTKVDLTGADLPTRSTNIQERYDYVDKFIEFGPSDIKKDLAQVTVPFVETVFLEASEPRPLQGAGLYYKGEPGYGGFIAIKLIGYDTGSLNPQS